ncbi:MAG: hypothetical protein CL840_17365 [Crocinitomicaceae bacterium]|nr:hypothetical protein [Crocinitomicaceae bacterium]|tara:strand:+ start:16518 stop:17891 length:1374 start_codon:yes stop_codon:yes gene_type:complete
MRKLLLGILILVSQPAFSQISKNVTLLSNWNDTTIAPNTRENPYNEVWGFALNHREYAVIGSTYGTHIIDVTRPTRIYQVDSARGAYRGTNVVHRDYKVYKNYLYAVCDEGGSSLQIFDLQYLPDSLVKVYDEDSLFKRAHNIFIDSASERLYVCGTEHSALIIYSIKDPLSPQRLTTYTGLPEVHDIYVRHDFAYINGSKRGFYIVDFYKPKKPVTYTSLTSYPDKGYNHSGWLNERGDIFVFCDETRGKKVKVYDVSDLKNIKLKSTLTSGVDDSSIAHNVIIKGEFAFFSYYADGLQIFDISDPSKPVKTGFYDTHLGKDSIGFHGAWGIYPLLPSGNVLVSDMKTGLYVFNVDKSLQTHVAESLPNSNDIKIYPNPFSTNIDVDLSSAKAQRVDLVLYDELGKEIETRKEHGLENEQNVYRLHLKDAISTPKVYLLKVLLDDQVYTYELVKSN